jgi:hypothetical protein
MSTTQATPGLLNSWKEIATYLGRGVRTVQRWEKLGLPVRRIGVGSRAPVLAYARDIDLWIQATRTRTFPINDNLPIRGSLRESIEQARLLRDQMAVLREGGRKSLLQLIATVGALEKSYATQVGPVNSQGVREFKPGVLPNSPVPLVATRRNAGTGTPYLA